MQLAKVQKSYVKLIKYTRVRDSIACRRNLTSLDRSTSFLFTRLHLTPFVYPYPRRLKLYRAVFVFLVSTVFGRYKSLRLFAFRLVEAVVFSGERAILGAGPYV